MGVQAKMMLSFLIILFRSKCVISNMEYLIEPEDLIEQKKCIPIPFDACRDLGYNMTSLPNLVGLEIQSEAEYSLGTFQPLVKFGCSSQLQFFLCSLYAPMCSPEVPSLIGPCRPLCEGVRERCAPILSGFGFPWPSILNCSSLPIENNDRQMCMEGPLETVPLPSLVPSIPSPSSVALSKCARYFNPQLHIFLNSSNSCAPLCGANIYFSANDKAFAGVWIAIWAVMDFFVCVFIVSSFLLDSSIFKFPERAAVYICLCYAFIAAGYLVRLAVGVKGVSCHKDPEVGVYVTITEGALNTPCAIVFLLLYYFANGAGIWWILLGVAWILKAWRGLSHEKILRLSSWFHVAGWGIPAALTIVCLFSHKVDSDELTGVCYIGAQNSDNLVKWVIVPMFIYIVGGTTLVILVFACLWKARSDLSKQRIPFMHIDVSAARLGIQALICLVPATCLLGISFYELWVREEWKTDLRSRPSVEVLTLKIFMSLSTGLMMGLFLINALVLDSWRKFWKRLSHRKGPQVYLRGPTLIRVSEDPLKGHIKVKIPQETILQPGPLLTIEKTVQDYNAGEKSKSQSKRKHHL